MAEQALVVGLGQFGMALSRALVHNGLEVVAVDRRGDRVAEAATFVARALATDATDEDALARLAPSQRDVAVCAIGDDSREGSIVVTALLRQLGAPRVVARASDALHERILRLVGAHEVVNPERSYGERLALRLARRAIVDAIPLGDDLTLTEVLAPVALVARSLADLALPRRFRLTVVAVRRGAAGWSRVLLPNAELVVEPGDVLVLVGPPGACEKLLGAV